MRQFLTLAKALSDETRVRALMALKDGELCLCQLIDLLGLAPSTVSKHMTLLLESGLVERRKEGRWHFYRLAAPGAPTGVQQALEWCLTILADDPLVTQDTQRRRTVCKKDLEELAACYRSS